MYECNHKPDPNIIRYELYVDGKLVGVYKPKKYPTIRKHKLTHEKISKAFGFKNVNSFRCSSAFKRYMNGIETILNAISEDNSTK